MTTNTKYAYVEQPSIIYEINNDLIPPDSLLDVLKRNSKTEVVYTNYPDIEHIISYVKEKPVVLDEDVIKVLNTFGIYRNYDVIWEDERFMRENMYNSDYVDHPMNTESGYKLYLMNQFNEDYLTSISTRKKHANLLFDNDAVLAPPDYSETVEHLHRFNFLFESANVYGINMIMAGEYILRSLTEVEHLKLTKDKLSYLMNEISFEDRRVGQLKTSIDVFFITQDLQLVADYLDVVYIQINQLFNPEDEYIINYMRTRYVISFTLSTKETEVFKINFFMGIYRTHSELLHSFDIDCRCIGWDGQNVWATERCKYAIYHGMNTVNFELMADSYELRLAKYGAMDYSIKVHGIDKYILDYVRLNEINSIKYSSLNIESELDGIIKKLQYLHDNQGISVSDDVINELYNLYNQIKSDPLQSEENKITNMEHDDIVSIPSIMSGLSLLLLLELRYRTVSEDKFKLGRLSEYEIVLQDLEQATKGPGRYNPYDGEITYDKAWYNRHQYYPEKEYKERIKNFVSHYRKQYPNMIAELLSELGPDGINKVVSEPQYNVRSSTPKSVMGKTTMVAPVIVTGNVVADLTIPDLTYKAMTIYNGVNMTQAVNMKMGDETTGMFTDFDSVEVDEDSWYIGPFVTESE